MPAALVPRPWDFTPAPVPTVQPAPTEDPEKPSNPSDPVEPTEPTSPSSPSTELPRPASPPTLLPPLTIHESSFDEPGVNAAEPIDKTPAPTATHGKDAEASEGGDLPVVAIVPPTPTSARTSTSVDTVTAV